MTEARGQPSHFTARAGRSAAFLHTCCTHRSAVTSPPLTTSGSFRNAQAPRSPSDPTAPVGGLAKETSASRSAHLSAKGKSHPQPQPRALPEASGLSARRIQAVNGFFCLFCLFSRWSPLPRRPTPQGKGTSQKTGAPGFCSCPGAVPRGETGLRGGGDRQKGEHKQHTQN